MLMDAIDRVVMNARLHYLGSAARIGEPVQHLAVLTCMDARVDPAALLGLRPGDAHIIRNAGGRASTDALHALAISQAVLHTREVMVLHHTDCALGRFTDAQLHEQISAASGHRFEDDVDSFSDPLHAIAQDIERIRACPYLPARDKVRGFMYDLTNNLVTEVGAAGRGR
jgi:carbonic anhydrase